MLNRDLHRHLFVPCIRFTITRNTNRYQVMHWYAWEYESSSNYVGKILFILSFVLCFFFLFVRNPEHDSMAIVKFSCEWVIFELKKSHTHTQRSQRQLMQNSIIHTYFTHSLWIGFTYKWLIICPFRSLSISHSLLPSSLSVTYVFLASKNFWTYKYLLSF